MENKIELLPCPFCGSQAALWEGNYAAGEWGVVCKNKKCEVLIAPYELTDAESEDGGLQAAVNLWNTRATPAPVSDGERARAYGIAADRIAKRVEAKHGTTVCYDARVIILEEIENALISITAPPVASGADTLYGYYPQGFDKAQAYKQGVIDGLNAGIEEVDIDENDELKPVASDPYPVGVDEHYSRVEWHKRNDPVSSGDVADAEVQKAIELAKKAPYNTPRWLNEAIKTLIRAASTKIPAPAAVGEDARALSKIAYNLRTALNDLFGCRNLERDNEYKVSCSEKAQKAIDEYDTLAPKLAGGEKNNGGKG